MLIAESLDDRTALLYGVQTPRSTLKSSACPTAVRVGAGGVVMRSGFSAGDDDHVDSQGLRDVAARGERLHQRAVPALPALEPEALREA